MTTTNYINTFIEIAEDSATQTAEIPPQKGDKQTAANMQFDMIMANPYHYTSDDVFCCNGLACNIDPAGSHDFPGAAQHRYLVLLQEEVDTLGVAVNGLLLEGHHFGEVKCG